MKLYNSFIKAFKKAGIEQSSLKHVDIVVSEKPWGCITLYGGINNMRELTIYFKPGLDEIEYVEVWNNTFNGKMKKVWSSKIKQ